MSGAQRPVLIYDGECGICRRSVRWVRARDPEHRVETIPYQDPSVGRRFPEIPAERLEAAIQLVRPDGRRFEGARAVEELLGLLPGWRIPALLFRVPGVRRLARRVYARVARSRRRFGCGDHCALPAEDR